MPTQGGYSMPTGHSRLLSVWFYPEIQRFAAILQLNDCSCPAGMISPPYEYVIWCCVRICPINGIFPADGNKYKQLAHHRKIYTIPGTYPWQKKHKLRKRRSLSEKRPPSFSRSYDHVTELYDHLIVISVFSYRLCSQFGNNLLFPSFYHCGFVNSAQKFFIFEPFAN